MTNSEMTADAIRACLADTRDMSPPVSDERLRELGYETREGDIAAQRTRDDARDARLIRIVPEQAA